jgi:hypothetical protein
MRLWNQLHPRTQLRPLPTATHDPSQRQRLIEIRDNLTARTAEAEREGWLGEAERLRVSLAAAKEKLTQTDNTVQRRAAAVALGMPAFPRVAARTVAGPRSRADRGDEQPTFITTGTTESYGWIR